MFRSKQTIIRPPLTIRLVTSWPVIVRENINTGRKIVKTVEVRFLHTQKSYFNNVCNFSSYRGRSYIQLVHSHRTGYYQPQVFFM